MLNGGWSSVPARSVPERPSFTEPALASSRRAVHRDPLAPEPAFALGWRVPDPVGNLDAFLPFVLQAGLLADGEASRLHRRLVLQDRLVTSIGAYLGVFGDPQIIPRTEARRQLGSEIAPQAYRYSV